MKKFIHQLLLWLLIVFLLHILTVFFFADGYFDSYYKRFTTKTKSNLIIGTSRAAQGIVPDVICERLGLSKDDFLNFAFNITVSPFGEKYNNAILHKINNKNSRSIFIITVDPWSLSIKDANINNFEPRESNTSFWKTIRYNSKIGFNMSYLYHNLNMAWGQSILYQSIKSRIIKFVINNQKSFPGFLQYKLPNGYSYLHDHGWLEVTIRDTSDMFLTKRISDRVAEYENIAKRYTISDYRIGALNILIDTLQSYGNIYLVRMPVHDEILNIEDHNFPEFGEIITQISTSHNIPYYDFNYGKKKYRYTDGNHLLKSSAYAFSRELAELIQNEK